MSNTGDVTRPDTVCFLTAQYRSAGFVGNSRLAAPSQRNRKRPLTERACAASEQITCVALAYDVAARQDRQTAE